MGHFNAHKPHNANRRLERAATAAHCAARSFVSLDDPLSDAVHQPVQAIIELCHSRRSESKDERLREPTHSNRLDIMSRDGAGLEKNANQVDRLHLLLIQRSTVRRTRLKTVWVRITENSQDTSEGLPVRDCPRSHAPMMPGTVSTGDRSPIGHSCA